MRSNRATALLALTLAASPVHAALPLEPGSLDVKWNEGASDCAHDSSAAIQAHACNPLTFILRESLCATPQAPFIYLLVGKARALHIDTDDVADSSVARSPGS